MEIVKNTAAVSILGFDLNIDALATKLESAFQGGLSRINQLVPASKLSFRRVPVATKVETIDSASPHIVATVVRIAQETHDTKSYFFQTSTPLNQHKAGAHINIEFSTESGPVKRTYTLSSSPKLAEQFSITVKRVNQGVASNWLFENLKAGQTISVSQPQGSFVLPYQPAGKILMLSAGSGITPLMSMLRYLAQTGNRSDILFLNYSQSPKDIIFHDELMTLADSHNNITPCFAVERDAISGETLSGRINKQQLTDVVPDIQEREIYLCGPQPFMKATLKILDAINFNQAQLHLENFTADRNAAAALGYSAELTFSSIGKSFKAASSKTILEEAEAAGLTPAAACRIGICKTCRCKKQSGITVNLVTGEESSKAGDYILPCVSVAKTATTIEL